VTYTYDENGNRLCKGEQSTATSYSYVSNKNRLASTSGGEAASYSYDDAGNTTDDGTYTYEYNDADRLESVDSGSTATYTYDGDGRRVVRTASGTTTYFFYDPFGTLLSEVVSGPGAGKDYVYLNSGPIARVDWSDEQELASFSSREGHLDAGQEPVVGTVVEYPYSSVDSGLEEALYFYHTDHLGTSIAMTDPSGAVVWRAEHLPFGGIYNLTVEDVPNNLRFPGQYADDAVPLYYNMFRDYMAGTGRFLEPDPIGLLGGANIFAYTNNLPTTLLDPSGLDDASPWQLGWEWLTGWGPRTHSFGQRDPFTGLLRNHAHIESVRSAARTELQQRCSSCNSEPFGDVDNYGLSGLQGVPKYIRDYSTLMTGGTTGNLAVTFLGSYLLNYEVTGIDCCEGTANVAFHVDNSSTINSATHPPVIGYYPWWDRYIGRPLNSLFASGPMSETTQESDWTEALTFSGNPCCR